MMSWSRSVNGAGAAGILYGSAAGLTDTGAQYFSQDSPNVKDIAEDSDFFGWYVKLGDFNGDGSADLVSSAAFEDMGTSADAGSVQLLYGSLSGIVTAGNQVWTQDHTGVKDLVEAGDLFGNIMD